MKDQDIYLKKKEIHSNSTHTDHLFKWFIYQPTNHNTILTEAIMLITLDKNLGSFCSKWMNRPLAMIIRMQGITKMHTSMEDDIFCIGYIFFYSFSYFIYLFLHQTISIFKRKTKTSFISINDITMDINNLQIWYRIKWYVASGSLCNFCIILGQRLQSRKSFFLVVARERRDSIFPQYNYESAALKPASAGSLEER